jgi:flagellar basal-body rod modification protein FlgD
MASAIFHHAMTAGQAQGAKAATPLNTPTPGASGASASGDTGTSDGSQTISANDFLTLLVTEMKNQDPTADTDPNEYINQLVQVNSLEQLIDINQTLSGDVSGSASSSVSSFSGPDSASATGAANPPNGSGSAAVAPASGPAAGTKTAEIMQAMHVGGRPVLGSLGSTGITPPGSARERVSQVGGNLGVQKTNPAARRVGHALAGRTHAAAGALPPSAN